MRWTNVDRGKSAIDILSEYVKIMTLDMNRVPILRIDGSGNERRTASAANTPVRVAIPSDERNCNVHGITSKPQWATRRPSVSHPQRAKRHRKARIADQRKPLQGPAHFGRVDREVRSFRLRKADGTIHIVSETLEGCTCTCLDYIKVRSLKGKHCKHLLAAFAVGLLDGQKGGAK